MRISFFRKGLPSSRPRGFPARRSLRRPSVPRRPAVRPSRALPCPAACPPAFSAVSGLSPASAGALPAPAAGRVPAWGCAPVSARALGVRRAAGAAPAFSAGSARLSPPRRPRRFPPPAARPPPSRPPPGAACARPNRGAGSRRSCIRAAQTSRRRRCAHAPSLRAR